MINRFLMFVVGLLAGRLAGELVTSSNVTFLDYVGREKILSKAEGKPFWEQLSGCSLCVGFWFRLVVALVLVQGTKGRGETLTSRLIWVAAIALVGYETDRQWTFYEQVTGRLTESGREL